MKKDTVIYFDGGTNYKGQLELSPSQVQEWHKKAAERGHLGFLSGYRYWDNKKQSVIVYFENRPTQEEILHRRRNGFLAAGWHYL